MTDRQCFPCTACCEGWLTAEINGVKMEPGSPCVHCTKKGCEIYEKRPKDPCVSFKCGWLREPDKLAEHMKPSECGAIVRFSKWRDKQVLNVTPTGKKIPNSTLEWLYAFARKYSSPLILSEFLFEEGEYKGLRKTAHGPDSFIRELKADVMSEDKMTF